jgi:hypothetical protein
MHCERRTRSLGIVWGVFILASTGCGGMYDATVTGVVKLDGNIVPHGTVSFAPQSAGPTAFGQIQSDGAYQLRTGREEGLPPGQYIATVAANEPPAAARSADGGPSPLGKPITPEWYRDPATSGLAFTVESGDNVFDLELKSTPPPGWKPPPARR